VELLCYTYEGWNPRIRPASSRREWMDATPESYAYRCLPLKIANAHGWEVLSPCGFSAEWNGDPAPEDVHIETDPGTQRESAPVALFGSGTLTFHMPGIIRTPPGWNLWVGGSPNAMKDGIAPLGGVIETDWSPFSFTMNWRFTRAGHRIRFEENEPFAFIFPVQRGAVEQFEPRVASFDEAPELKTQFEEWSRGRDAFHERMRTDPPGKPSEKWQKFYYRGLDASGCPHIEDHQAKLSVKPFKGVEIPQAAPTTERPQSHLAQNTAQPLQSDNTALAKRDWILKTQTRLRSLLPGGPQIDRLPEITAERFLAEYYALNRPVLLTGELSQCPALRLWSPEYLKSKVGPVPVEFQGSRTGDPAYERAKDAHKAQMPFDAFIDLIESSSDGNDAYITAYNSGTNAQALAPLAGDLAGLDHLLEGNPAASRGMMWIGGAGTFTPLHHDLTNNLLVQITGTKHVVMAPPRETPRLYNDKHVFSQVADLEDINLERFPEAADLELYRTELRPGEALFLPIGWWHQVVSEDFSVSLTYTNFRWPNDFHRTYPAD
jgi:hypothetical protein